RAGPVAARRAQGPCPPGWPAPGPVAAFDQCRDTDTWPRAASRMGDLTENRGGDRGVATDETAAAAQFLGSLQPGQSSREGKEGPGSRGVLSRGCRGTS